MIRWDSQEPVEAVTIRSPSPSQVKKVKSRPAKGFCTGGPPCSGIIQNCARPSRSPINPRFLLSRVNAKVEETSVKLRLEIRGCVYGLSGVPGGDENASRIRSLAPPTMAASDFPSGESDAKEKPVETNCGWPPATAIEYSPAALKK